jgi:predicted DNA-binding transcriptional regulator AlpA
MALASNVARPNSRHLAPGAQLLQTGFLRLPGVLQLIPVARSTWWEGVRTGRFPAPVKIGGVTAWRVEDIHALIARISDGELADLQIGEVR